MHPERGEGTAGERPRHGQRRGLQERGHPAERG